MLAKLALFGAVLALVVALVANVVSRNEILQRTRDNKERIAEVSSLVHAIQRQRAVLFYEACVVTNHRSRHSRSLLHRIILRAEKANPGLAHQYRASERTTDILINALVPPQHCKMIAKRRFGYVPK